MCESKGAKTTADCEDLLSEQSNWGWCLPECSKYHFQPGIHYNEKMDITLCRKETLSSNLLISLFLIILLIYLEDHFPISKESAVDSYVYENCSKGIDTFTEFCTGDQTNLSSAKTIP